MVGEPAVRRTRSRAGVRSAIAVERTAAELVEELRWAGLREHLVEAGAVVVPFTGDEPAPAAEAAAVLSTLPVVVVGLVDPEGTVGTDGPDDVTEGGPADPSALPAAWREVVDVVARPGTDRDAIVATVDRTPLAAVAYALLLRGAEGRDHAAGLIAESTTYSMLQGGPELAAWLAERPRSPRPQSGDVVRVERRDDVLVVTLDRPEVRNALSSQLRDELLAALAIAELDDEIHRVELRGAGPSFCAGGDLDEFGSFADPATAHCVRLEHSIGRTIAGLGDRVTAFVHGACYGSGIELPAFAPMVVADPGSRFALPELGLGLIPGAGGTVSITERIGRHRTAWLGLSGREIDARTALAWNLVDVLAPVEPAEHLGPSAS